MEQSKVDHATKRKPTRPAKVPSGTKTKKRKTDNRIVNYGDTIHTVCEGKWEGVHFNEDDDPNFVEMVKQGLDYTPFKLDNSSEKTDIELLETGEIVTQEEEQAVHDLLCELRFMNQTTQTDSLPPFEMPPGEPQFHPVVSHTLCYPNHDVEMGEFVSKQGGEYVKYPYLDCDQYFYNDGNYPGEILLSDDGIDLIWGPPEQKDLHYHQTPEQRDQFSKAVNALKKKNQERVERNVLLTSTKEEESLDLPGGEQIDSECLSPKQRQGTEKSNDKELKNAKRATKPITLHPFPPRWNPNFFNGSLDENIQERNFKTEEEPDSSKCDRPGEYSKTGRQYVVTDRNNIIITPSQLKGHVYDDAMVCSWLKDHPDEATFKPGWVNF